MIKKTNKEILEILNKLSKDSKVLDVGGASAPFKRANSIIDIVPFKDVYLDNSKGDGDIQFNENSYTKFDICSREKWPFSDKQFDYSICSHVLEDIRDPLWVCSEIIRVSKAGYIEVPSFLYETSFNIESRKLAGASHHRWVIKFLDDKIIFTFKYFYIHTRVLNRNRKKPDLKNDKMYLKLEWKDKFEYEENWLNSGKEIFEFYLGKKLSEKETWRIYRKIGNGNIVTRWLAYLKNTNNFFKFIFYKIRR